MFDIQYCFRKLRNQDDAEKAAVCYRSRAMILGFIITFLSSIILYASFQRIDFTIIVCVIEYIMLYAWLSLSRKFQIRKKIEKKMKLIGAKKNEIVNIKSGMRASVLDRLAREVVSAGAVTTKK